MLENMFKRMKKYNTLKPKQIIVLFTSYVVLIIVPILALGILFTFISTYQLTEQTKSAG